MACVRSTKPRRWSPARPTASAAGWPSEPRRPRRHACSCTGATRSGWSRRARESAGPATTAALHRADLASLDEVRALADDVERATDQLTCWSATPASAAASPTARRARRAATATSCASPSTTSRASCSRCACCRCCGARRPRAIVNVASLGQAPIDFDDLMLERGYSGGRAYGPEQARADHLRLRPGRAAAATGSRSTACTPRRTCRPRWCSRSRPLVDSLEDGVEATARLASTPSSRASPAASTTAGEAARTRRPTTADARGRLWELSRELTGEREPFV